MFLKAGSALVAEKSKFDSKQRRLKIACNRWKVGYTVLIIVILIIMYSNTAYVIYSVLYEFIMDLIF